MVFGKFPKQNHKTPENTAPNKLFLTKIHSHRKQTCKMSPKGKIMKFAIIEYDHLKKKHDMQEE